MRFIPTNCATASLPKSTAVGRAIAAITARLDIPAGSFSLAVWKSGFERVGAPCDVEIAGDVSVQVEMKRVPQEPEIWDELL